MRIRQACANMLMVGGMLVFAIGSSQAEQSKSGTPSGSTMGSETGSGSGGSSGMKPGHESSGKMGQDSSVITKDNPGGIVTRGGRGEMPSDSKVDPLSTDQRKESTKSGPGSAGNKSSSGNMGSSGGTGSSGGGGGY